MSAVGGSPIQYLLKPLLKEQGSRDTRVNPAAHGRHNASPGPAFHFSLYLSFLQHYATIVYIIDLEKARTERNNDGGLGLASMQERTRFSGGSLVIESAARQGTTIRASWQDIERDLDE